jgi:hypothetical protein
MDYIIKMENTNIPENGLNGKVHNPSPLGKPRTRWVDVVLRDTSHILRIKE